MMFYFMIGVQVNLISLQHLKANKSDHASRRGLLKMIGQRKRLLAFINTESVQRYQNLADTLGIRRIK